MRPGTRLRSWADRVCSRHVMDRLIDPVLADLQHEYEEARENGPNRRLGILTKGYLTFWKVASLHVPVFCAREILRKSDWAVGRALGSAAVTMFVVTALLVAAPLQELVRRDVRMAWQLLLLLPQSLPFSLPLSILVGVLAGLRGQPVTSRIRRAVLVVGLAGTLTSFGTIAWLVPAANQAFRVTIAGRDVARGPAEMPSRSLRERAIAAKTEGRLREAGRLLFSYHARWALVGSALVFALFGLGVTTLRTGRAATAAIGTTACIVYITYFFELSGVHSSVFSDERVASGLAWLPNILLLLTSIACLSARDETRRPQEVASD